MTVSLPTTIYLKNLFPPIVLDDDVNDDDDNNNDNDSDTDRPTDSTPTDHSHGHSNIKRRMHSYQTMKQVLVPIQLQIIILSHELYNIIDEKQLSSLHLPSSCSSSDENMLILFSRHVETPTCNPEWTTVDEDFDDIYDALFLSYASTIKPEIGKSGGNSTADLIHLTVEFESKWKMICKHMKIEIKANYPLYVPIEGSTQTAAKTLADAPVDMAKLKCLPHPNQTDSPSYRLPPNTLLLAYADGQTRIIPSLYQMLLSNASSPSSSLSPSRRRIIDDSIHDCHEKRFEDEVFDVLGTQDKITSSRRTTSVIDAATSSSSSDESGQMTDQNSTTSSDEQQEEDSFEGRLEDEEKLMREQDSVIRKRRIQVMKRLIQEEEEMLEWDRKRLEQNCSKLSNLLQEVKRVTLEVEEIIIETSKEADKSATARLIIEGQRNVFLRQIHRIYPIRSLPNGAFSICGIPIPNNFQDSIKTSVESDELLSSALGFVCHAVFMSSKFLSIPLRYRLVCNSSRSAIQEDHDIYPLFVERVVEKEQFVRAMVLLCRNIDLLLTMKAVTAAADVSKIHFLAKLQMLLES